MRAYSNKYGVSMRSFLFSCRGQKEFKQEAISKINSVSFPELLGSRKFAESKILLLWVVVVLHSGAIIAPASFTSLVSG